MIISKEFWERLKFFLFLIDKEDTEYINLPDNQSTFDRVFRRNRQ